MNTIFELLNSIDDRESLKEAVLIEKYQTRACIRAIKRGMDIKIKSSTRGNGVAVTILIEIYNKITNSKESAKDYILHHKNGNHEDNQLPNLVLINKTKYSHQKLHSEIANLTAQTFLKREGLSISQMNKIDSTYFDELSPEKCIELINLYNEFVIQYHKEKYHENLGIILLDEIIK